MKTTAFKTLVKEIIKEVMNEIDDSEVNIDDLGASPDYHPTRKSDKNWQKKYAYLNKIKNEPKTKDELEKQRAASSALDNKAKREFGSYKKVD